MKQTVRINTFETNSSSMHSCVILTEEEQNKWAKENGYLNDSYDSENKVISKQEVESEYEEWKVEHPDDYESYKEDYDDEEDIFSAWCKESEYYTFDSWGENYEGDTTTRVINGTTVYVHCYYGYEY